MIYSYITTSTAVSQHNYLCPPTPHPSRRTCFPPPARRPSLHPILVSGRRPLTSPVRLLTHAALTIRPGLLRRIPQPPPTYAAVTRFRFCPSPRAQSRESQEQRPIQSRRRLLHTVPVPPHPPGVCSRLVFSVAETRRSGQRRRAAERWLRRRPWTSSAGRRQTGAPPRSSSRWTSWARRRLRWSPVSLGRVSSGRGAETPILLPPVWRACMRSRRCQCTSTATQGSSCTPRRQQPAERSAGAPAGGFRGGATRGRSCSPSQHCPAWAR